MRIRRRLHTPLSGHWLRQSDETTGHFLTSLQMFVGSDDVYRKMGKHMSVFVSSLKAARAQDERFICTPLVLNYNNRSVSARHCKDL